MWIFLVKIDQNPDCCQQFFAGRRLVLVTLTEELRRIETIVGIFQQLTRKSGQLKGFQIGILFEDWRLVQRNWWHPRVNVIDVGYGHRSRYQRRVTRVGRSASSSCITLTHFRPFPLPTRPFSFFFLINKQLTIQSTTRRLNLVQTSRRIRLTIAGPPCWLVNIFECRRDWNNRTGRWKCVRVDAAQLMLFT